MDAEVPWEFQQHIMATEGQCFYHKVERFPVMHRDQRDILGLRVTIVKAQSRVQIRGGYVDYAVIGPHRT